jgi:hypothetical protein
MPRLDLDLTDAQVFTPIEDGQHVCTITAISEPKRSPNSVYVNVEFTVKDSEKKEHIGRKMWRNYPVTGKGAGFFIEFWAAATGEQLEPGKPIGVDTDDALGQDVLVQSKQREYPEGSGDWRAEPEKVMPAK